MMYNSEGLATGPQRANERNAIYDLSAARTYLQAAAATLVDDEYTDGTPAEEIAEELREIEEQVEGLHRRLEARQDGQRPKGSPKGSDRRPNPPVVRQALERKRRREVL
jgi:hypothetical protein